MIAGILCCFLSFCGEGPMDLDLKLQLDQPKCVQGQSVLLTATLTYNGQQPIDGLRDFHPFNKAILLRARDRHGKTWIGLQQGAELREMTAPNTLHWHHTTVALQPKGKLEVQGDLLRWIGALPVGEYTITAIYEPGGHLLAERTQSNEVRLVVSPAKPTFVSTPRLPEMPDPAPLTAVWRHGSPEQGKLFIQQQSRIVPPNPLHCFELPEAYRQIEPQVSSVALAAPPIVHLLWAGKGEMSVMQVSMDKPADAKPWTVKVPVKEPVILQSPRTTADGGLLALFTDKGSRELYLLQVRDKKSVITPLSLNAAVPLDQYCVYWTLMDQLEFAWSPSNSRDLYYTAMDPKDPTGTFAPVRIGTESGALLRIDALYDRSPTPEDLRAAEDSDEDEAGKEGDQDDFAEGRLSIFSLFFDATRKKLVLTQRQPLAATQKVIGRIDAGEAAAGVLEVIDSAMTVRGEPVYLLKDQAGKLFYATTRKRSLQDLKAMVGEVVTADQLPSLMAASPMCEDEWVYLRFVRQTEGGFKFAKLEPDGLDSRYKLIEEEAAVAP